MRRLFFDFVNLLLYGNFWIAACAWAMYQQNYYLFFQQLDSGPVAYLLFFGTLFLYAIHRTIGLRKVQDFTDHGRYFVIARYKRHIQLYALIGLLGAGLAFLLSDVPTQLALLIPALIALAYVLPIIQGGKKRLRDFGQIKIWAVALCWAWLTVGLPALAFSHVESLNVVVLALFLLERFCFIFAITLPFDIRDLHIDQSTAVHTLPAKLGLTKSLYLAHLLLVLTAACIWGNFYFGFYPLAAAITLTLFLLFLAISIQRSPKVQHDYYFTAWMDGSMLLSFFLVYVWS